MKLQEIMRALRDAENGCPWDRQQDFNSLIPYTLEEVYEVVDAIERAEPNDIKEELGDLLFQIIFYSQLASEQDLFDFSDVANSINKKLIRRHPHVFADAKVADAQSQAIEWEKIKQQERKTRAGNTSVSLMDHINRALPSLMRAEKIQKSAASVGFDWPDISGVISKVKEELDEVQQELKPADINLSKVEDEIGDLLFSCVNLSRHAGLDTEMCLRKANLKFERRFKAMETLCEHRGVKLNLMSSDELENSWNEIKTNE